MLVKLAKPNQELRIDLPAIGVRTMELMKQSRVSALVIEAGKAIMLDPQGILDAANKFDIAIVAADTKEQLVVG